MSAPGTKRTTLPKHKHQWLISEEALPFPCQKPNRVPGGQRWWKTRRALNRYDSEARYSLIVSLHVPETNVELLTPVQLKVDTLIASQVELRPEKSDVF